MIEVFKILHKYYDSEVAPKLIIYHIVNFVLSYPDEKYGAAIKRRH